MTPENFCYWLQGMFELTGARNLSPTQVQAIKGHLALVFDKQTEDFGETIEEINVEAMHNIIEELVAENTEKQHIIDDLVGIRDAASEPDPSEDIDEAVVGLEDVLIQLMGREPEFFQHHKPGTIDFGPNHFDWNRPVC